MRSFLTVLIGGAFGNLVAAGIASGNYVTATVAFVGFAAFIGRMFLEF